MSCLSPALRADERRHNNDVSSPNRVLSARRLIVERKMTPILSKSPVRVGGVGCSPPPSPSPPSPPPSPPPPPPPPRSWPWPSPYLAPPQTAGDVFFSCGLQKRSESLKLRPRSAAGISRSGGGGGGEARTGWGEEEAR